MALLQLFQGFAAMAADDHFATQFAEDALGDQLIDRVILHQ